MIEIITKDLIKNILPVRLQNSNKGDFGKVLNICSSEKYIGAGFLSSIAALKVGAGYSILCSCDNVINHLSLFSPNLIYKSHGNFNFNLVKEIIENANITTVVLGCGIGQDETTIKFIDEITDYIKNSNIHCVLDADALNCVAKLNKQNLGKNFVLTPHPKELSRLLSVESNEIIDKREYFVLKANEIFQSTILLKGNETLIVSDNENIYKNITGNSALAKAGTGDVLSGMIGGFCAQKTSLHDAAILSAYIHGLSADIYANEYSEYSMLATDLLDYIPIALKLCK